MIKRNSISMAVAVGAAMTLSSFDSHGSPFQLTELPRGYMLAQAGETTEATTPPPTPAPPRSYEGRCGQGHHGSAMHEGMCGAGGYRSMDADGSGNLSEDEFVAGRTKMHEGRCGEGMCGARGFHAMDANGDGKVDEDEYMSGRMKIHEGKCGEGMCGGKSWEGKCGEGMCGGG